MRITRNNRHGRMSLRPDAWAFILVLILAFSLGGYVAHLGWHHTLYEAAATLWTNPCDMVAAWVEQSEMPSLDMDMDFEAYQQLYTQRSLALQRGANFASATDYVPATVTYRQDKVSIELRLPEVHAEGLSDEHWPLELVVLDGQTLLGMRWATLTPATKNTRLTEIYLALSRDVGIPISMQHTINLNVNGARWGTYTLQALPATEMLKTQDVSPESVVVWFDQRAYLEAQPNVPGYSFAYARIAVARVGNASPEDRIHALKRDPVLAAAYARVSDTLRELERGEINPSQVFDAEQLGRFLALRTLWYGSPALDWRSMYLLYDPATRVFTPVARGGAPDPVAFLPASFTYDTEVWASYVQALETLSTFEFQEVLRSPWQEYDLRAISAADLAALRKHQARVRDLLYPPRTLFAEATIRDEVLVLHLDAMLPFAVEVVGLGIGERGFMTLDPAWVVEEGRRSALAPVSEAVVLHARLEMSPLSLQLSVPLRALPVPLQGMADELHLVTCIWGLDKQISVPITWEIQ